MHPFFDFIENKSNIKTTGIVVFNLVEPKKIEQTMTNDDKELLNHAKKAILNEFNEEY